GWDVTGTLGAASTTVAMTCDADGTLTGGATLAEGGITADMSTLTAFAGLTTVEASGQDGRAAGTLQSFTINADGTLLGSFSSGLKQALGRVALSTFTNPAGLEKAGGSLYRTTVNSGDPQIGAAGTGGRGE